MNKIKHFYSPSRTGGLVKYENVCSDGVAVSLGSSGAIRAGSTPVTRTKN